MNRLKIWGWQFVVNTIAASLYCPAGLRYILLKNIAGYDISKRAIGARCWFIGHSHLKLGKGSNIGGGSHIELYNDIVIEENVHMAPNCILTTATHKIGDANCRCGTDKTAPIIIEDGCWIGINTTILPGVTIGQGTIISAGSVVKKNCKPNSIYAGNPAEFVSVIRDKAPIM